MGWIPTQILVALNVSIHVPVISLTPNQKSSFLFETVAPMQCKAVPRWLPGGKMTGDLDRIHLPKKRVPPQPSGQDTVSLVGSNYSSAHIRHYYLSLPVLPDLPFLALTSAPKKIITTPTRSSPRPRPSSVVVCRVTASVFLDSPPPRTLLSPQDTSRANSEARYRLLMNAHPTLG